MELPADIRSEDELGDWLHGQLVEAYGLETEAWARERVERVAERLNVLRTPARRCRPRSCGCSR